MNGVRVLHVCASLGIGGLEQVVLDLVHAGRAAGHDDRVLVFDALEPGEPENPRAAGVPIERVRRRRGLDRACVRAIEQSLSSTGARVVHAHNDTALVLAAFARRAMPRVTRPRLVVTFHNRPPHRTLLGRWLARWATGRADAVVTVSAELCTRLRAEGWLRDAELIVNGVDVARFGPRETTRAPGPLRIGMLARFAPPKRHDLLFAAARLLAERGLDVEILLAGDGPQRERVLDGMKVLSRARWVGFVADPAAFLAQLDVLAVLSDHEGTPLSMLEGIAMGLPVVASSVGGIPAIAGEADGALIVPNEAPAIADAFERLVDPHVRAALGARARTAACGRHAVARAVERYEALYSAGN
ncbi:MAG: glycosyltransferase family 4 protein [Planctomycetes bacterium]|nr:glycosyltransferase family 4 protein [Planctomycetota bacterium]